MLPHSPEEKKSSILHRFAYKFNCQKKIPGKFLLPNKLTEDKSTKSITITNSFDKYPQITSIVLILVKLFSY